MDKKKKLEISEIYMQPKKDPQVRVGKSYQVATLPNSNTSTSSTNTNTNTSSNNKKVANKRNELEINGDDKEEYYKINLKKRKIEDNEN